MALVNSDFSMEKPLNVYQLSFYVMLFEIADCLRQIYAQEKNSISGWFCVYLLKLARNFQAPFVIAKWHAFYVEYFQRSNKLTEAFAEAHCLKRFVESEFDEDYVDWLEDNQNALGKVLVLNDR